VSRRCAAAPLLVERTPELTVAQCQRPGGRVHGWRASYWPNGAPAMFGEYRDGLPHGLMQAWHANGKRRLKSRFASGRREGRSATWYPSGRLRSTVRYVSGVQHGVRLGYYPSGHPMSRALFRDGVKQVEGAYRRSLAHGLWTYWDQNGNVDAVIHWRRGVEVPAGIDAASE
jgi:antitoxin component YwqK of YwqJK toxin-antitoxin module